MEEIEYQRKKNTLLRLVNEFDGTDNLLLLPMIKEIIDTLAELNSTTISELEEGAFFSQE